MFDTTQVIGLVSATLTTASFAPQAVKTWRTRSTADLSPLMFSLFCLGVIGWLIYGIIKGDLPIILANIVTICLAGIILFFIFAGRRTLTVSHIGIYVRDLEKMKDFYCTYLKGMPGANYSNPTKKFTSCFIRFNGHTRIELMQVDGKGPATGDRGHVAFLLDSRNEVDSLTQFLGDKGVEVLSPPRLTGDGYYESCLADPEGNIIELTA